MDPLVQLQIKNAVAEGTFLGIGRALGMCIMFYVVLTFVSPYVMEHVTYPLLHHFGIY